LEIQDTELDGTQPLCLLLTIYDLILNTTNKKQQMKEKKKKAEL